MLVVGGDDCSMSVLALGGSPKRWEVPDLQ